MCLVSLAFSVTLNPNCGACLFVWNPNPNLNFVCLFVCLFFFGVFCVLEIDWLR